MSDYADAAIALYQAGFGEFVAERKRLAAELKAAGDKDGAARLAKLGRPPVSAWAVNQLWWHERAAFDALLEAAGHVKVGDREASQRHREALAQLRERATRLLQEGGNAATEQTLRRVTTTLSAVAALGGFAPDAPGALTTDRDPPGFEALGFGVATSTSPERPKLAPPAHDDTDEKAKRAAEAERRRVEEEARQRRLAERERLSGLLRDAQLRQGSQQRELSRLRAEALGAEQSLKETQALLADLEAKLASL